MQNGHLYIVSAPSGAGKSSLIAALIKQLSQHKAQVSISHTTRQPRPGEQHGVHYYFSSVTEFEQLIEQGLFLEYANVFGNYYGTSIPMIERTLAQGMADFPDRLEFAAFWAITRYNQQAVADAVRLLVQTLAASSADPGIQRYRRALLFYAEHLDEVW